MSIAPNPQLHPAEELGLLRTSLQARFQRFAEQTLEIGRGLIRAKELLPHGRFQPWIQEELGISPRWARQFMLASERFGSNPEVTSGLPGGVVLALASPSVPDGLVEAVIERRVPPTIKAIDEQMAAHRGRKSVRRATRNLVAELWDLPDDPDTASKVLADAVLAESEDFVAWAWSTLMLVVDRIGEAFGEA